MLSRHLKASPFLNTVAIAFSGWITDFRYPVIARSALAQEEAEEFSGEYSDPINIHLENDRDGCPC